MKFHTRAYNYQDSTDLVQHLNAFYSSFQTQTLQDDYILHSAEPLPAVDTSGHIDCVILSCVTFSSARTQGNHLCIEINTSNAVSMLLIQPEHRTLLELAAQSIPSQKCLTIVS